ncbi:MAG: hypothetical protein AAF708_11275 [Deinococcota bacterium]
MNTTLKRGLVLAALLLASAVSAQTVTIGGSVTFGDRPSRQYYYDGSSYVTSYRDSNYRNSNYRVIHHDNYYPRRNVVITHQPVRRYETHHYDPYRYTYNYRQVDGVIRDSNDYAYDRVRNVYHYEYQPDYYRGYRYDGGVIRVRIR